MGPFGRRQRQHPLGHVHADHLGGSGRREAGELSGAAAEIQHAPTVDLRQDGQQIRPLGSALPPAAESLEGRIAGKEDRVVVDVLRFSRGFRHWCPFRAAHPASATIMRAVARKEPSMPTWAPRAAQSSTR
jgi:hypothetical protein